jgi:hypothetical protein
MAGYYNAVMRQKLTELRTEHRALDEAISGLSKNVYVNQLHLRRLKKRKLQIRDMITRYESKLIPDIDA